MLLTEVKLEVTMKGYVIIHIILPYCLLFQVLKLS